jgi:hypothetical protein
MSPFAAKIDRFVRWFFNVSPTTTEIEPQPPRRRAPASPRRARPASPKDRRDARPAAERREKRGASQAARSRSQEGA